MSLNELPNLPFCEQEKVSLKDEINFLQNLNSLIIQLFLHVLSIYSPLYPLKYLFAPPHKLLFKF